MMTRSVASRGVAEVKGDEGGNHWPHTMDAQAWTEEWLKTIANHPEIPTDWGTMVGWFANAIMAGYDTAMARHVKECDGNAKIWVDDPT